MANKKVVPGFLGDAYKRRQGDFAPNLVGNQFTQGSTLFTLGNFEITTNTSTNVLSKVYNTGDFSDPYTLDNLNLTIEESEVIDNSNTSLILNIDPSNVYRFAYFGSFVEFIRVNVEQILEDWKGSIYVNPSIQEELTGSFNTVLSYSYDEAEDKSTFLIPVATSVNNFGLITEYNTDTPQNSDDISNLTQSFPNYLISNDYGDFPVAYYSGDTTAFPYMVVTVEGDAFPTLTSGGTTFGQFKYHLKPTEEILEKTFFSKLDLFQNLMLNRLTEPKYTLNLLTPKRTEVGIVNVTQSFTWPTTDGYNIDFNTSLYGEYITRLYEAALTFDNNKTNLIVRKYVSDSIQEYDTIGGGDDTTGRKVNKLLKIYGREFDELKQHIDSISFTNNVTYSKKDNLPDELIKLMAKTLGFDVLQSLFDENLFDYIIPETGYITFSGYTRNLSTKEIDIELWRRLVINAWWLYKSKGHRKVIEFFLKLFDIPECLVDLDEYIYIVKDKLDVEETFRQIEEIIGEQVFEGGVVPAFDGGVVERADYPIDEYGFPRTLPNTNDYYFQMNGFWYNGGTLRKEGNNPHFGPYDYGQEYFNKFRCMVDSFNGVETGTTIFTVLVNYFNDYNSGVVDEGLVPYSDTYANFMTDSGRVNANTTLLSAGRTDILSRRGTDSFRITFSVGSNCELSCPQELIRYDNGILFANDLVTVNLDKVDFNTLDDETLSQAAAISPECCQLSGGFYAPLPPSNSNNCPAQSELQITKDGTVLGINSQDCCVKEVVGSDVTWDGKNCKLTTVATGDNPTTTVPGTEIISAQKMFLTTETNFVCWWCPEVIEECDTTGCKLLLPNGSNITDSKCCTLRGGQIQQNTNGDMFCFRGETLPGCPTRFSQAIETDKTGQEYIVVLSDTGEDLTENCCNQYSASVNITHEYVNGRCRRLSCPTALQEYKAVIDTDTVDGVGLEVLDVTNPSNPQQISEACCEKYAQDTNQPWYYESTTGRCLNNNNVITSGDFLTK